MIEDKLYQALQQSPASEYMARFKQTAGSNTDPAVFYQYAPNDKNAGWPPGPQYPRMTYNIDWHDDPQRKTSGVLTIDLLCRAADEKPPESIAPTLAEDLSQIFLTDADETVCIVWRNTEYFEETGSKGPKIIGATILFDVWAFPAQKTGVAGDPVECVMRFIKNMEPQVKMMGTDSLKDIDRATDDAPVIYVRLKSNTARLRDTYATQWFDAIMGIHIIAATPAARQAWTEKICRDIAREAEYLMDNGKTMRFITIAAAFAANPLETGQLTLTTQYGVLTQPKAAPLMNHINLS